MYQVVRSKKWSRESLMWKSASDYPANFPIHSHCIAVLAVVIIFIWRRKTEVQGKESVIPLVVGRPLRAFGRCNKAHRRELKSTVFAAHTGWNRIVRPAALRNSQLVSSQRRPANIDCREAFVLWSIFTCFSSWKGCQAVIGVLLLRFTLLQHAYSDFT